jgi:hypothetical protein
VTPFQFSKSLVSFDTHISAEFALFRQQAVSAVASLIIPVAAGFEVDEVCVPVSVPKNEFAVLLNVFCPVIVWVANKSTKLNAGVVPGVGTTVVMSVLVPSAYQLKQEPGLMKLG